MINTCSLQYAIDNNFWEYPLYHGTTNECRLKIERDGFQIFRGAAQSGCIQNGYTAKPYWNGIPPPVHHLGYGIYFTTNKAIAKQFNGGSTRGLSEYRISVHPTETINFGAPRTMMKWWIDNGYDPELAMTDRVLATQIMTERLTLTNNVIWFKGKGLYRLLDGDQVCVYHPELIYKIDNSLSKRGDIGSKVIRKSDGMKGTFLGFRQFTEEQSQRYHNGEPGYMTIKWTRGGNDGNVYPSRVEFL